MYICLPRCLVVLTISEIKAICVCGKLFLRNSFHIVYMRFCVLNKYFIDFLFLSKSNTEIPVKRITCSQFQKGQQGNYYSYR